mgnify:CR=1 FL=1
MAKRGAERGGAYIALRRRQKHALPLEKRIVLKSVLYRTDVTISRLYHILDKCSTVSFKFFQKNLKNAEKACPKKYTFWNQLETHSNKL